MAFLTPATALIGGTRLILVKELLQGLVAGKINRLRVALLAVVLTALSYGLGGPRHPLWARVLGIGKYVVKGKVEGEVAPGFEAVRKAFQQNVDEGFERGAQFVVYHKGKKVVDLYGGTLGDKYDGDSIQLVFSVSKNISALVIAHQVSKGLIDYDEKVSKYWPEFAQNGKEDITVADVLRHEAGLAYFGDGETKLPYVFAKRNQLDDLADFLAEQAPIWATDKRYEPKERIYHAFTRGFILQELVRRTDPAKRSLGVVLREEITGPLGIKLALGEPTEEERKRLSLLQFDPLGEFIARHYLRTLLGMNREDDKVRVAQMGDPTQTPAKTFAPVSFDGVANPAEWFNQPETISAEMGSVNVLTNSRSLGVLADLMARAQLLPEDTHKAAHDKATTKYDHMLCFETTYTQGGFANFEPPHWDEVCSGFCGWGGYGGNQFVWNQELEIGLAYSQNGNLLTSIMGFRDPRCLRLTKALRECIDKQSKK